MSESPESTKRRSKQVAVSFSALIAVVAAIYTVQMNHDGQSKSDRSADSLARNGEPSSPILENKTSQGILDERSGPISMRTGSALANRAISQAKNQNHVMARKGLKMLDDLCLQLSEGAQTESRAMHGVFQKQRVLATLVCAGYASTSEDLDAYASDLKGLPPALGLKMALRGESEMIKSLLQSSYGEQKPGERGGQASLAASLHGPLERDLLARIWASYSKAYELLQSKPMSAEIASQVASLLEKTGKGTQQARQPLSLLSSKGWDCLSLREKDPANRSMASRLIEARRRALAGEQVTAVSVLTDPFSTKPFEYQLDQGKLTLWRPDSDYINDSGTGNNTSLSISLAKR